MSLSVYSSTLSPVRTARRYDSECSSPLSSSPPSTSPFRQQDSIWQQPRIYVDSSPRMDSRRERVVSMQIDSPTRDRKKEQDVGDTRLRLPSFKSLFGGKDDFVPERHSDYHYYSSSTSSTYSMSHQLEVNLPPISKSRKYSAGSSFTSDSTSLDASSRSPSLSRPVELRHSQRYFSDIEDDDWGDTSENDARHEHQHSYDTHDHHCHYSQLSPVHHDHNPRRHDHNIHQRPPSDHGHMKSPAQSFFFSPSKCSPYPRRTFFQESSERGLWVQEEASNTRPRRLSLSPASQKCSKAVQASEPPTSPPTGLTRRLSPDISSSPLPPSSPPHCPSSPSPFEAPSADAGRIVDPHVEVEIGTADSVSFPTQGKRTRTASELREQPPQGESPMVLDQYCRCDDAGSNGSPVLSQPSTQASLAAEEPDCCGLDTWASDSTQGLESLQSLHEAASKVSGRKDRASVNIANPGGMSEEPAERVRDQNLTASFAGSGTQDFSVGTFTEDSSRADDLAGSALKNQPLQPTPPILAPETSSPQMAISNPEGQSSSSVANAIDGAAAANLFDDDIAVNVVQRSPQKAKVPKMVPYVLMYSPSKRGKSSNSAKRLKADCVATSIDRHSTSLFKPNEVGNPSLTSTTTTPAVPSSSMPTTAPFELALKPTPGIPADRRDVHQSTGQTNKSKSVITKALGSKTKASADVPVPPRVTVTVRKVPAKNAPLTKSTLPGPGMKNSSGTGTDGAKHAIAIKSKSKEILKSRTSEVVNSHPDMGGKNSKKHDRAADRDVGKRGDDDDEGPLRKKARASGSDIVDAISIPSIAVLEGGKEVQLDTSTGKRFKPAPAASSSKQDKPRSLSVSSAATNLKVKAKAAKYSVVASAFTTKKSRGDDEHEEDSNVEMNTSKKSTPLFYPSFSPSPSLPPFETSLAFAISGTSASGSVIPSAPAPTSAVEQSETGLVASTSTISRKPSSPPSQPVFEADLASAITGVAASGGFNTPSRYRTLTSSPPVLAVSPLSSLSSLPSSNVSSPSTLSTPPTSRSKTKTPPPPLFEMELANVISGIRVRTESPVEEGEEVGVQTQAQTQTQTSVKSKSKSKVQRSNVDATAKVIPVKRRAVDEPEPAATLPQRTQNKAQVKVSESKSSEQGKKKLRKEEMRPFVELALRKQRKVQRKSEESQGLTSKRGSLANVKGRRIVSDSESSDEEEKEVVKPRKGAGTSKITKAKASFSKTSAPKMKAKSRRREVVSENSESESESSSSSDTDSDDIPLKPSPFSKRSNFSSPKSKSRLSNSALPPLHPLDAAVTGLLIETMAQSRASSHLARVLYKSIMGNANRRAELKRLFGRFGGEIRERVKASLDLSEYDEDGDEDEDEGGSGKGRTRRRGGSVSVGGVEGMSRDEVLWVWEFERVMEEGAKRCGIFGKIESSAKDDSDLPIPFSSRYFYVPDCDPDRDRAALIVSIMPRAGKRSVTKTYKQYYWKPLGKVSRWEPEEEL